ncbi:hypothetical protein [Butyrivibrio fibrisolvens]|uniref:hypothetical protein n=1 Tax=Butyrivibrio fibrisolvens TaxID=831 RepID=UPI00041FBEC0|nr:hypothetical protein [Butyrivibrio fibrisolvens]
MKKIKLLALLLAATTLVSGCNIQLSQKDSDISREEKSDDERSDKENSNKENSNKESSNVASTLTSADPDKKEETGEGSEIEAYREFLRDYYDEEEQEFYATILLLDEDEQYELAVLVENGIDAYDVYLYLYEDGQVVPLNEDGFYSCGADGNFYYFSQENCFYYEYDSFGGDTSKITEYVYSIQDGELVLEHEFSKETEYDSEESTYYVDSEVVDEDTYEDYESEYDAYSNDSFLWLNNSFCDFIDEKDDIEKALSRDYEDEYYEAIIAPVTCDKPVIYLYPEKDNTYISAQLDINGYFTCLDPAFNMDNGWNVVADRNGDIHLDGKTYDYLFWEAELYANFSFDQGFCVAGDETKGFLEKVLPQLGLNEKETSQFIEYWLPIMEKNPYNVISFQADEYTDCAGLEITPKPDTMIRVFMAFYESNSYVELPEQTFTSPEREGFVAIEWGGSYVR